MCTNGVNTGQLEMMIDQIDDHIKLERRHAHDLGHLASDAGFATVGEKLHDVMRLLDAAKIPYRAAEYEVDENDLNGMHAAEGIGMPPEQIFKTLVAKGERGGFAVFCIPVCCELDLKKAAKAAHDKKIELIHVKDLLATTGYIRGGCSPIGMKKLFPTYIDETAQLYDEIGVSAGCRGCQVLLDPMRLADYVNATLCDLTE